MGKMFDEWRARSPNYGESHEAIADSVRRFIAAQAAPHVDAWEAAGILGLGFPEEFGGTSQGIDPFHWFTQIDEIAAPGAGGLMSSLMTHLVALPPILNFGSREMQRRVAPAVLSGCGPIISPSRFVRAGPGSPESPCC